MVTQYPHTLFATTYTGGGYDGAGDILPSSTQTVTLQCRAESSDGNGYISGVDGKRLDYSWIIYVPLPFGGLAIGSKVEVKDEQGNTTLKDTVKGVHVGQLGARIWL